MPLRASGLVLDRRMVPRLPLLAPAIESRCAASATRLPGLSGSVRRVLRDDIRSVKCLSPALHLGDDLARESSQCLCLSLRFGEPGRFDGAIPVAVRCRELRSLVKPKVGIRRDDGIARESIIGPRASRPERLIARIVRAELRIMSRGVSSTPGPTIALSHRRLASTRARSACRRCTLPRGDHCALSDIWQRRCASPICSSVLVLCMNIYKLV